MISIWLFTLCLATVFSVQGSPLNHCAWTDPSTGLTYDFTSLLNNTHDYYLPKGSTPITKWDIYINMCRPVLTQICGAGVAGCQQWSTSTGGHASLGVVAGMQFTSGSNSTNSSSSVVTAQFFNGDSNRQFQIDFICDRRAGVGFPAFMGEYPALNFQFEWVTAAACSQCGGSDCSTCLNGTGCKWCLDSGMCVTSSNKVCGGYVSNPKYCPRNTCSALNSCQTCTSNSNGNCAWCLDTDSCMDSNVAHNTCANAVDQSRFCTLRRMNFQ